MFDLKCKRQNCKYNENNNCVAKNVKVDKETECKTFEEVKYKEEQNDVIKQVASRKDTCVDCKADCLFNDHCCCKANGISVLTNDNKPECSTFLPK